mmetsp:Transcript_16910/g.12096  ORF Transcript_16910/g.12096 Transcript_16910/m.12096 type:complete len:97 (+) Transcript_16910:27-317(+)
MDAKKKETDKNAAATSASATSATTGDNSKVKAKSALELLEEDDEFEEFEGGNWNNPVNASEDAKLWQDDWEDDNVTDDFAVHLRAQIESRKANEGK